MRPRNQLPPAHPSRASGCRGRGEDLQKKCTHTLYIYVRNGRNTDFPLLSMDRSKMGIPELIDKGQGLNLLGCWPFHFQDAVPKMKMLVVSKMKMRNRSETSHQKWCLKKSFTKCCFLLLPMSVAALRVREWLGYIYKTVKNDPSHEIPVG